jgi:hypothetical protein
MKHEMILALALGAAALVPAPALAQPLDWNAAKTEFEAGVRSADKPDDRDKQIGCTAFWSEWNNAVNAGRVPTEAGARVSKLLVAPDSNMMALGWLMVSIEPEAGEDPAAVEAEVEAGLKEVEPFAAQAVSNALAGNGQSLAGVMRMLGICDTLPD